MSERREQHLSRQIIRLRDAIAAELPRDAAFVVIAALPPGDHIHLGTNVGIADLKELLRRVSDTAQAGGDNVRVNEHPGAKP